MCDQHTQFIELQQLKNHLKKHITYYFEFLCDLVLILLVLYHTHAVKRYFFAFSYEFPPSRPQLIPLLLNQLLAAGFGW